MRNVNTTFFTEKILQLFEKFTIFLKFIECAAPQINIKKGVPKLPLKMIYSFVA